MQLVSVVIFAQFQSYMHCKYFLLKEDQVKWLAKAAAAIIISSLQDCGSGDRVL